MNIGNPERPALPPGVKLSYDEPRKPPVHPQGYMLIRQDNGFEVLIETDITNGGQCTATTQRDARCRMATWPHGIPGEDVPVIVNGVSCTATQPFTRAIVDRFLAQRCLLHFEGGKPFCPPEWLPVQEWEIQRYPAR